jgi:hypothetical protein
MALSVYSHYIEVCTCDRKHFPRHMKTLLRYKAFRKLITKQKKRCAKDCQGQAHFSSDQMLYLPDLQFYTPGSWAGDVIIEHLAFQISAFEWWGLEKITSVLRCFKILKTLTLICLPEFWNPSISDLVRTPHPTASTRGRTPPKINTIVNWPY